jgi:threonine dehydratase
VTTADDVLAAAARIRESVFHTPLRHSDWLSSIAGTQVRLKLEVVQPTGSYKIRGALNAVRRLRENFPGDMPRLVTASAGNHGRALAEAARMFDARVTVFVPADAPRAKVEAIRAAGAELREWRDYDEAEREAKAFARSGGGLYISPYSNADVIAGAGTVGLELIASGWPFDTVVVPIGGGGLISGIAIAVKHARRSIRVVGVEVAASCPFTKSLQAGRLVTIDVGASLADGLTGNLDPDTITLDIVRELVDEIVVVDEPLLRDALKGIVGHEHLVIEGAAAAGPAAILGGRIQAKGGVAVVLTGANIDTKTLLEVLSPA